MNIIDKRFYNLVNDINSKSIEEVYLEILNKFKNLNVKYQNTLQDYFKKFPYWGNLSIKDNNYEEIHNRANVLKNHLSDLIWLYEHLEDYRSRYLLLAILNNWYQYDFEMLSKIMEKVYPDYFDLDIVPYVKDAVFVDLGSYTGDTVLSYIYCYEDYQKIYCYEITKNTFEKLKENTKMYPNIEYKFKAAGNKKGTLFLEENKEGSSANRVVDKGNISVDEVTIDEDITESITHIKMDIEGYEQKALKGCRHHIINDHPILLLSVYHNYEDIWKIPKMIIDMNKDYKFYLRYHGNTLFPTEITLIAIPC